VVLGRGATAKLEEKMKRKVTIAVFLLVGLVCGATWGRAQTGAKFELKKDVVYATHDGVPLMGDIYIPMTPGRHPAMMFVHGGAFRAGSKDAYATTWGPYLAERGYLVFSIDYRLAKPGQPTWPQALLDCKAALQYLRGDSGELGVDPDRIGVGGDSAGGELAAMLGVTQDWVVFTDKYPKDSYSGVSTKVKAVVPVYGVYDMMAWEQYTSTQPNNPPPLDILFGGAPTKQPHPYFEASPLHYVREAEKKLGFDGIQNSATDISWFVAWGTVDTVVPPESQSVPFVQALRDAGASVTEVPVPGMDHFWFTSSTLTGKKGNPKCEEETPAKFTCSGATPNDYIVSKLMDFLAHNL
jgi:acetyl esterase/lipase